MVINQFWDDVKMDFDFFSLFSFHSRERFNPHKHTLSLSLSFSFLSLITVSFLWFSIPLNMTCTSITFNATSHNANANTRNNGWGLRRLNCLNIYIDLILIESCNTFCLVGDWFRYFSDSLSVSFWIETHFEKCTLDNRCISLAHSSRCSLKCIAHSIHLMLSIQTDSLCYWVVMPLLTRFVWPNNENKLPFYWWYLTLLIWNLPNSEFSSSFALNAC